MKIRTGFVSNSSSSSFMVYGAFFDKYDDKDILKKAIESVSGDITDDEFDNECIEYMYDMFKRPYSVETMNGYGIVIGIDPSQMDIDKTIRKSMNDIKEYITGKLGDIGDRKFGWYEDCSYDGW